MASADWWARKLGQPSPQQPPQYPHVPQAAPPVDPYAQPMAQVPQQYQPGQAPSDSLSMALQQRVTEIPTKAKASRLETGRCPECGSGNWFTGVASDQGPKRPHCYDCGYPLLQSGSGMASVGGQQIPHAGPSRQTYTPPPPDPQTPLAAGFKAF